MTLLRVLSAVVGVVVAFGYFVVFHRMIRWSLRSGQSGRMTLILAAGFRQLILAGVLVGLWALGLSMGGLLAGLVLGVAVYRILLVRRLRHQAS